MADLDLIRDAEAEAFWLSLRPGQRLLVYYSNDDCWHERMAVYPACLKGGRRWYVATPDHEGPGGRYLEALEVGVDITGIKGCSLKGARPFLEQDIYSFSAPVDDDRLLALIKEGRTAVRHSGSTFNEPTQYVTWMGKVVDLDGSLAPSIGAKPKTVLPALVDVVPPPPGVPPRPHQLTRGLHVAIPTIR